MTDETKHHLIFPSYIMESHFEGQANLKKAFKKVALSYFNGDGFSDEMTGHVTMHHETVLRPLYEFAVKEAKKFVSNYNIDPNLFDYHVVKSWMNVTKNRETQVHGHKDAHISFSYYINVPEEANTPILFQNHENRHEPYAGMARWNNPKEWDHINSYTWIFDVREGQLMVFSSNMYHGTIPSQPGPDTGVKTIAAFNERRVCIAGDILLTYKEKQAKPLGLQPVENWRKFETNKETLQ
jgi:hypothetical protein